MRSTSGTVSYRLHVLLVSTYTRKRGSITAKLGTGICPSTIEFFSNFSSSLFEGMLSFHSPVPLLIFLDFFLHRFHTNLRDTSVPGPTSFARTMNVLVSFSLGPSRAIHDLDSEKVSSDTTSSFTGHLEVSRDALESLIVCDDTFSNIVCTRKGSPTRTRAPATEALPFEILGVDNGNIRKFAESPWTHQIGQLVSMHITRLVGLVYCSLATMESGAGGSFPGLVLTGELARIHPLTVLVSSDTLISSGFSLPEILNFIPRFCAATDKFVRFPPLFVPPPSASPPGGDRR
mmetsp:Transcript_2650/g.3830  ORF Transcript_2650/g.3830 Transcript_2650/m.3830 type:complete len:290 (+) Transcript_2650:362-1231(+)